MAKYNLSIPNCARSLAIYTLLEIQKSNSIQSALDQSLKKFPLSPLDAKLCTELVYGFSRYEIRINYVLDTLLKKRHKIPLPLQFALGVATYSLFFLTKIPHHASVNWTVNFAKNIFGLSLSKVCNGVLRSIIRLENKPLQSEFYSQQFYFYSLPEWIYSLWIKSYGEAKTKALCEKSLHRPFQSIRLNKLHSSYETLTNEISNFENTIPVGFDGFVLNNAKLPKKILGKGLDQLHDEGAFSWQSVGSQEILKQCFNAVPHLYKQKFWDACTGQGGKSFALLEQGVHALMASDISKPRLTQFVATARRLKLNLPHLAIMSALNPSFLIDEYSILLDVPCSGLGTLSRRPDIRKNRSAESVADLINLQAQMLDTCFAFLSTGQYIVYLTCTLNPDENELQIENFLQSHSCSKLIFSCETDFTLNYMDGMYAAVLQKI